MSATTKRLKRDDLRGIVIADSTARRLARAGVLVPISIAPRRPVRAEMMQELRERASQRARTVESKKEEPPGPDHRGRMPDHFEYGSDD